MLTTELRQRFLGFCGKSRFRKFVTALTKRCDEPSQYDRLKFWQETLWNEFLRECDSAPTDVNVIGMALHWCDLHNESLVTGPGYQPNDLKHSLAFDNARAESFPHGFGWLHYHCPQCKKACSDWVLSHAEECSMLQRKIVWEEWLAAYKDNEQFTQAVRAGMIAIEDFMPGDEIWEWDNGRGQTGLSIVRDGQTKTSWASPIKPKMA